MFTILKQLKKFDIVLIFIITIFIAFQSWIDLKLPEYTKKLVTIVKSDNIAENTTSSGELTEFTTQTSSENVTNIDISAIIDLGLEMIGITFISLLISIVVIILSAKIASNFAYNLRTKLYKTVQKFSIENVQKFSIASLITRVTNDVVQVQGIIVIGIQAFVRTPILAGLAITKIMDKNPIWSIALTIAIFILVTVSTVMLQIIVPKFKLIQKLIDKINNVARENINGIKVVKAYNAEKYEEKKFAKVNDELTGVTLFTTRMMSILFPGVGFLMNLLILSIYFLGAVIISRIAVSGGDGDKLSSFGDIFEFTSYGLLLFNSFLFIIGLFAFLPRVMVSVRRIANVLNEKPTIKDGKGKKSNSGKSEFKVEFKNVWFKYSNAKKSVLKDISFTAKKGETIAFIGDTGSGKSTIINLIPRFFDVTKGEILVDGINVKDYKIKDLRKKIGYVSQTAFLFKGDLKENILFGVDEDKKSEEDMQFGADISESTEFIKKTEGGFENYVSLHGSNYSGGQKQRISIARAIAMKPEILIFDDSFSALDYKTDLKVRNNLKEKLAGTTIFIVAQRIGTIKNADKILVIKDSECVGIGKHEELLENCSVYKEIALSQLSEKELKNIKK